MSIILKGIDLPEKKEANCNNCWNKEDCYSYKIGEWGDAKTCNGYERKKANIMVAVDEDGQVYKENERGDILEANYIQAIQIPKGHGRLIDVEDVLDEFVELDGYRKAFEYVPTILEAEE